MSGQSFQHDTPALNAEFQKIYRMLDDLQRFKADISNSVNIIRSQAASGGTGFFVEVGEYVGNGTDPRTVNLANSSLVIKWLFIINEENDDPTILKTARMSGENAHDLSTGAFSTAHINSIGTGTFTLDNSPHVNATDNDYTYLAIGTM